jgi:hypothetical protein
MAASMAEQVRQAVGSWRHTDSMQVSACPVDVESVTVRYLMYVLLPAWFLPGIADYMMHRRTRIEGTSGLRESGIHALMMTEISVPLLLTALCEVSPLLLGIGAAAAGAREATAIRDVRSAVDGGREVRPAEQHIHNFLESLPRRLRAASSMRGSVAVPFQVTGGAGS